MSDPLLWHRIQFGFTITFHYIFPQLTMGLALLIVVLKGMGLRKQSEAWNTATAARCRHPIAKAIEHRDGFSQPGKISTTH